MKSLRDWELGSRGATFWPKALRRPLSVGGQVRVGGQQFMQKALNTKNEKARSIRIGLFAHQFNEPKD